MRHLCSYPMPAPTQGPRSKVSVRLGFSCLFFHLRHPTSINVNINIHRIPIRGQHICAFAERRTLLLAKLTMDLQCAFDSGLNDKDNTAFAFGKCPPAYHMNRPMSIIDIKLTQHERETTSQCTVNRYDISLNVRLILQETEHLLGHRLRPLIHRRMSCTRHYQSINF